jgi:hypothetical protein
MVGLVAEVLEDTAVRTGRALCADVSWDHAESLAATASRVDSWVLIEYRRLWSRDTIGGSGLSDEVKDHLRGQLRALPHSRLLFVRRPDRRRRDEISVFFGRSGETDGRFYALELESHSDLAGLDFVAALDGEEEVGTPLDHPLLVVCTHGKRDRCCAKYGRPLYEELCEEADSDWVWQSTHVGGDRFAGNVVFLPEGLYFGRVGRHDVWPVLDAYLARRIELPHYRGRSCYGFATQAAERRVREETGRLGIDDLRVVSSERRGDAAWTVQFLVNGSPRVHEVDVVAEQAEEPTYLTCAAAAPERPRRHRASAYRVISG